MYGDQFGGFVCGSWGLKGQQANHGSYWNPGTQVGAKNMDFSTVLQMDLTRSLVPSVVQGSVYLISNYTHYWYFVTVMTFLQLAFIILADNSLFLL